MSPETRNCQNCKKDFTIEAEDSLFYEKMQVPAPADCASCRRARRLAFGNYTTLYQRPNDAPKGGQIISCYPKEAPFPVFDFDFYWGNEHHPEEYALAYSSDEPFFKQFKKLSDIVPRPALTRDPSNVKSEYSNYGVNLKNCFYSFGGIAAENVDYSMWGLHTKDSQDGLIMLTSERMYESVFPERSYDSSFVYFSKDLLNCTYMYDCRDCSDCIGCVNLRHKRFYVFNEFVGEEEYKKVRAGLATGSAAEHAAVARKFWDLVVSLPVRGQRNEHATDSTGIYLIHSSGMRESVWCIQSSGGKWNDFCIKVRDSYDVTISSDSERMYNTALSGRQSWNNVCTVNCRTTGDSEYSMDLSDCKDCFGCIGLSNKRFCILNTQYTEEEYRTLVAEIKAKMTEEGTYGNFFPHSLSPFPYNATLAQVIYPKTKEEIETLGSYYSEPLSNVPEGARTVGAAELPDETIQAGDDITQVAVLSEAGGRPFRIREEDLTFYRRQTVPLSRLHPYERMKARFDVVNNFSIEDCTCAKCGVSFRGVLPSDVYMTYCDACYAQEIT